MNFEPGIETREKFWSGLVLNMIEQKKGKVEMRWRGKISKEVWFLIYNTVSGRARNWGGKKISLKEQKFCSRDAF